MSRAGVPPGNAGARRPREVTLADVARAAGVSDQTVSRVVNDHPHVSAQTRTRVRDAIGRLGYRPNFAARRLATNRSRSVGIVSLITGLWGPAGVRQSLELRVAEAGYQTLTRSLPAITPALLAASFDDLLSSGVDGIVVVAADDPTAEVVLAQRPGVPVVVVAGAMPLGRPGLGLDQVLASRRATEHLLDLGHVVVGHVSGPLEATQARQRRDGWAGALDARGLGPGPVEAGDWTAASGFHAGRRLLADPATTAVVVANDQMAVGVLRAAGERGRRVPEDLSVVGFDDVPEAAYLVPPLTTVRHDFDEVGRRVVAALRSEVEGSPMARLPAMAPEVVVRRSTAPPPPSAGGLVHRHVVAVGACAEPVPDR
ncbi:LacI family DNA-binding transcriptional regulator [Nocardioides aurantiacus]|uniref:LacI family transcriptional regulator n=1 Tax=Nocardioides aurantiacus TaxID=86796 RepID=A0A3N2CTH6_9ACTN|nr:LacI family DNA-binding transcriptional regulator [Nocardioides aurantiacus]ROR90821.1 LacI family transcriptional regulator [Nocardioides aurantiacus]